MSQFTFNPVAFGFRWTADGWYEFDRQAAIAAARRARDARARELKAEGRQVRKFTLSNQRIRQGGIGTGHPEIDIVVPIYYLETIEPARVPIAVQNGGLTYWAKS